MSNLTISVFGNQLFLEIIKETRLFSKFKIKFYENFDLCLKESESNQQLLIFFISQLKQIDINKFLNINCPIIIINQASSIKKEIDEDFIEFFNMPFSLLDLYKKIISLNARYEFKKSSLINLNGYLIDKNERKIKKNNLELQLTEKEINFLILFSKNREPLSRNFVLKNVWNYSPETDTHTIETHIHRLRKKISNKFKDNNFIKNNEKGYYI
tara:strand:- start:718 stop:1356 length:639 start_codon:yes stop_codon:yes gene_type:complete